MKDRNYTKPTEIMSIMLVRDNNTINSKKSYIPFNSVRQLERYRVEFEDKFNRIHKSNCKIDFHFRVKGL